LLAPSRCRELCHDVSSKLTRASYNVDQIAICAPPLACAWLTSADQATALSCRDRLIERWNATQMYHVRPRGLSDADSARPSRSRSVSTCAQRPQLDLTAQYLSLEFLMGRSLDNALLNLQVKDKYSEATVRRRS